MRKLVLLVALCSLQAADLQTEIRSGFIDPWISAVRSKNAESIKALLHPSVRACFSESSRPYFDTVIAAEAASEIKGAYKDLKLTPVTGAPLLFGLPADGFSYPVQPAYQIQLEFPDADLTISRYIASDHGKWFEVFPCPNDKGVAFFREQSSTGEQQRRTAEKLASELKNPLLSELKLLVARHRLIEAIKQYQQATGTELTTARMVIGILEKGGR